MKDTYTPRPMWISIISIMLAFLLIVSAAGGPQLVSLSYAKYAAAVPIGGITLSINAAPAILTTGPRLNAAMRQLSGMNDTTVYAEDQHNSYPNNTTITNVYFGTKTQYSSKLAGTGIDVSSKGDGSIMMYRNGSSIYIVSEKDRTLASNENFSCTFNNMTKLQRVEFPNDFDTTRTKRYAYFCYKSIALQSMINLNKFDTSAATTMQSMFYLTAGGADAGTNTVFIPDVSSFNTANVTDMGSMFRGCGGITSLNLSHFNTSKVTDTGGMFDGCAKLTSVNLSGFDTSKVTTMQVMFSGCSKLTSVDLSSFTCESLADTRSMFSGCSNLKTIYADYDFDCRDVASSGNMFNGCTALVGGYGTSYNANANSADTEIKGNAANATYAVIDLKLHQEQDVLQSTQGYFTHSSISGSESTAVLATGNDFNTKFKSVAGSTAITKIVFGKASDYPGITGGTNIDAANAGKIKMIKSGSTIYVLSDATICFNPASDFMFQNMSTVQNIVFDNIDTGAVRTMQRFFEGCSALKDLDLSLFDTKNVLDFGGFLRYCKAITTKDAEHAAACIDTSKARDIGGFFTDCTGITGALDLSAMSCAKTETMASFLSGCTNITSVDLTGFTKAPSIYNASNMFSTCKSLKTIYTSGNFNLTGLPTTSPATGTSINSSIFDGCTSLVGGNGTKFTTSQVGMGYARPDASGSPGYFTSVSIPSSLSLFAIAPMMLTNPDVEPELNDITADADVVTPSDAPVDNVVSGSDAPAPVVSESDVPTTTTTAAVTTTTTTASTTTAAASTAATSATTAATSKTETTAASAASSVTTAATTTATTAETQASTAAATTTASAAVSTTTATTKAAAPAAETTTAATTGSTAATSTTTTTSAAPATTTAAPIRTTTTTAAAVTTTTTAQAVTTTTTATTTTAAATSAQAE